MKISLRLTLAAFVPLFMLLVVGGALFFSYRVLNSARDDSQTARQIASSSSDLNGFVYSYVLHHEDRPKQQFLAAHDSITALVSGAHFSNGDQQRLLDTIRTDNGTIGNSFSALVSSYENAGLTNGSALAQQAQEQLTGQILLTSQEVHSDALRLQTLTDNNLSASQTRIIVLILVVMAITAVPLTIVLFQMRRSMGDSLSGLRRGVEVIGAGDLDHRIGLSRRDEFGDLARSFDEMTGRLQSVTVSKDALEREVEERKKAEESANRQRTVKEGINRVLQGALACDTEEELGRMCLAVLEGLTASKFGFIDEINAEGRLDSIAISDPGWEACRMDAPLGHGRLPVDLPVQGIHGRVIKDGRAFYTNDPATHPDRIGTPEGHPALTAFLGVPMTSAGKVIGMIGLGNREGGYSRGGAGNGDSASGSNR